MPWISGYELNKQKRSLLSKRHLGSENHEKLTKVVILTMFGKLFRAVSFLSCFLGGANSSSVRLKHPSSLDVRVDGSKRLKKGTHYCSSEAITRRRMCLTHSRNTEANRTSLCGRKMIDSHRSIRNSRILSNFDSSIKSMRNPKKWEATQPEHFLRALQSKHRPRTR